MLNGIAEGQKHFLLAFFSVDADEFLLEFYLSSSQEVSVLKQLIFYALCRLVSDLQALLDFWVSRCDLFLGEVFQVGEWVVVARLQLLGQVLVLHLQSHHELRCDLFSLKQLDLIHCRGTSVQNPTVDSAVWFLQALLHELDDVAVRHYSQLSTVRDTFA